MIEVLHVGSLVPAAVGTCCVIGDRRARSAVTWVPALVMLAAMLDVALGTAIVHPVVWTAVLVTLSLWPAVARRFARTAGTADMVVHRSLGLLIMAGLLMGHAQAAGHHAMGAGPGIVVVAGYLGLTVWLAVHARARVLTLIEVVSMGSSVALMGLAAVA